jgi:parallel beta-helix repeat protein
MKRSARVLFAIFTAVTISLALLSSAGAGVIYVNANCPGSTHDGASWSTAYLTIGAAISDAVSGDEIWVASATYVERITLTNGLYLYGGFVGTETTKAERNWRSNTTTINGSQGGSVVTLSGNGTLDGFTITNGRSDVGPGVYCNSAYAPIITNNIITANTCTIVGATVGGIYCSSGSQAVITNNQITFNTSFGAGMAGNSPVVISNNIIAGNSGGVYCGYPMSASAAVVGNTIVDNYGNGILCSHQPFTIANNIVAYNNGTGISVTGSGGNPTVQNNCLYGNYSNYYGISAGTNDIYEAPAFVDRAGHDYHVTGSSPCLNSALNTAPSIPSVDIDGETRTYDGTVDIGADEYCSPFVHKPVMSPGTGTYNQAQSVVVTCDTSGAVIHYTCDGSDPTESSSIVASGSSVAVNVSMTLKVKAFKSGLPPSATNTQVYTLLVATPTFDPDGYVGDTPQNVTISCASSGSTIHYTTTGIDPTESDPTIASGGTVSISQSTILKAKAFQTGWTSSGVKSAVYRFSNKLYVWKDSPGPSHNGFSWQTAFQSVGSALTGAVSGDEIWVARGTYVEHITMKDGVAIYGGFTGDETTLSARDWVGNETILDGNQTASVVSVPSGVTTSSRIDGFTITNGKSSAGAGILCNPGGTVIANNKIVGNTAYGNGYIPGGGIYFCSSTSTLINCIIANNAANMGGGICAGSSILTIANNTIVNNTADDGGGIYWTATPGTLENNIIAYNSSGIYKGASYPPTFDYNCVYGNTDYNYYGITASAHDVTDEPQFVDYAGGDYHILSTSPCRDYGLNTAPSIPSTDIDGQTRIENSTVDIGADEYWTMAATPTLTPDSGTYDSMLNVVVNCATSGAIMHYTTDGDAPTQSNPVIANGGSIPVNVSMMIRVKAWKTGIEPSYIKTATYTITKLPTPSFSPDEGISNIGIPVTVTCLIPDADIHYTTNGVDPTESDPTVASGGTVIINATSTLKARAYKSGFTESDVKSADYAITNVLYVDQDAPGPTHDGFTWQTAFIRVQDALDAAISGNEIWVAEGTYTELITLKSGVGLYGGFAGIEGRRAQRNWVDHVSELYGNDSGTVVTVPQKSDLDTVISGFTIQGGSASYGGGIICESASPTIENNIITNNIATSDGGGILCTNGSRAVIANNLIISNKVNRSGGGIVCDDCEPLIANNTFVDNMAGDGGAIYCTRGAAPTIANNIVAYNTSGIFVDSSNPNLLANYFGQNYDYDYLNVAPGSSDVTDDEPRFIDQSGGNYHLDSHSVCIDAGDDSVVDGSWLDMDREARISDSHVDIGAYELSPVPTPAFAPDGGISNQSIVVTVTCSLSGATIHYTTNGVDPTESDPTVASGGTITISSTTTLKARAFKLGWSSSDVKSALYTITNVIYVDQDASGSTHDGYTWQTACLTINDALNVALAGNEIWVAEGFYEECIGLPSQISLYGGFSGNETSRSERDWTVHESIIDCNRKDSVIVVATGATTATVIDGFVIQNGSSNTGGGIRCSQASPTIMNNVIADNYAAEHGGGVACVLSDPAIKSNIFLRNTSPVGSAISCVDESQASVVNNTLVENGSTKDDGVISVRTSALPELINNIVAFNESGLSSVSAGMKLYNNNVYGNTAYNYSGISPSATDISSDPLFVNRASGNLRLKSNSPCIDAGSTRHTTTADFDGMIRPQDGDMDTSAAWDIGAYEYPLNLFGAKKIYTDSTSIAFGGTSVTAQLSGQIYAEKQDRTAGIRIDTTETFPLGAVINVSGTIQTDSLTGERYVAATSPWPDQYGELNLISSLGFTNNALGGGASGLQQGIDGASGLNNIGLLVLTFGSVIEIDPNRQKTWFVIDDGSGVSVKVVVPSDVTINTAWQYVVVRGISSCEISAGACSRVIRVRNSTDIWTF